MKLPCALALAALTRSAPKCLAAEAEPEAPAPEPWLKERLEWFQDMKFGFILHWGIYSLPRKWADEAQSAGMKYVVFTTKHHDGFAMFDTRLSDFRITAPDVPFHSNVRSNVVREVFNTFRGRGFGIGAYFSKADWHSP